MVPVLTANCFWMEWTSTALPLSDLRGEVAMVPQEGFLFTSTLADNLRYGDPCAGDDG